MDKQEHPEAIASSQDISRRRLLLGGASACAVVGGSWLWWRSQPPAHDRPRLTPAQAFAGAKAKTIVLVDIRTPREWSQTGIPDGAVPIDMRRKDFLAALDRQVGGERDAAIALICARGVRSARMTNALVAAGFHNVMDVPEGMLGSASGPGWLAGNLPVTRWNGA